jgi:hypothetical protein
MCKCCVIVDRHRCFAVGRFQDAKSKGEINPEFIDVFCEKGVFEADESRKILQVCARLVRGIHVHSSHTGERFRWVDGHRRALMLGCP